MVVDTGSTNRTREIAREFRAQVFDFVWANDFAAARNAARAKGEYAFWLDADDVLDPPQRVKLQTLLDGLRPGDEAAHVVRCSCDPGPNGDGGQKLVDHIRLFPMREGVRWTYAVHEQILSALRRANVPVRWTDLTVRHTGYTDPALRERKLQRDCKILEAKLAERPRTVASGQWSVASKCRESGEWRVRTDQFCSVDQGIYGHLTLRNLAALAEERGDRADARRLWKMDLEACPGDPEAMARGEA